MIKQKEKDWFEREKETIFVYVSDLFKEFQRKDSDWHLISDLSENILSRSKRFIGKQIEAERYSKMTGKEALAEFRLLQKEKMHLQERLIVLEERK